MLNVKNKMAGFHMVSEEVPEHFGCTVYVCTLTTVIDDTDM